MNSKPHRTNSDFQLLHFMAGDCKTPDGAWSLLYGQKIDIEVKIAHSESQRLRRDAMVAKADSILNSATSAEWEKLEAQADKIEVNAGLSTWLLNTEAAKNELATIQTLMDALEPFRLYKHLSILEAGEACQQEEWRLELLSRAENHMITRGSIPPEELRFMRNHPEFESSIIPHIQMLTNKLASVSGVTEGLKLLAPSLVQQMPVLLAPTSTDTMKLPTKVTLVSE